MKTESCTTERVLVLLLKEPFILHTATSLAKAINITRQGIWKTLHTLTEQKLIQLETLGETKTSTTIIKLNWTNPLTEKTLSLILTKESLKQQRWRVNFADMEDHANFLILFGSILYNPKEANDIDILAVIPKRSFKVIEETAEKIQQTQLKKIHLIDVTTDEFRHELKKPNKAYRDAVKKGIILYGQDNFIHYIRSLQK